jgi:hypothetical protein
MALLTAGTFLCAAAVAEPGSRFRLFFLGGLCQGLTAFAYPPMAPAPIVATLEIMEREDLWGSRRHARWTAGSPRLRRKTHLLILVP